MRKQNSYDKYSTKTNFILYLGESSFFQAYFKPLQSMDNTIPLQLLNEHLNSRNVEKAPPKR